MTWHGLPDPVTGPASDRSPVARTASTWQEWFDVGAGLHLPPGVHPPSRFSALLASTMGDCADLTVIDAGSGAGLISVAALAAGAKHVIAIDSDPAAVSATQRNVCDVLGARAGRRLTAQQLDFDDLGRLVADVVAVNPPQRPARILPAVEPDQQHLHDGGGADGLDTVRLVLSRAASATVRTTAADALHIETAGPAAPRWDAPVRITHATMPMHPSWSAITAGRSGVGVWDFHALGAGPRI